MEKIDGKGEKPKPKPMAVEPAKLSQEDQEMLDADDLDGLFDVS